MREGEKLARKYHAASKALSQGVNTTQADTALAGKALAQHDGLDEFISHVTDPLRASCAQGDDLVHEEAAPSDYLSPQRIEAWKFLADLETTLPNYLKLYKHHIAQRAVDSKTPIPALEEWQKNCPEFVKRCMTRRESTAGFPCY